MIDLTHGDEMLQIELSPVSQAILKDQFPCRFVGIQHCHHVTLYHPRSCSCIGLFNRLSIEEEAKVHVLGVVRTNEIDALVVTVEFVKRKWFVCYQAGDERLLHITLNCYLRTSPVMANKAIKENEIETISEPGVLNGTVRVVRLR